MNEQDKEFLKDIGRKIAELRKQQKLSKTQLAFELNTSEGYIRRIEEGKVNIGVVTLKRLSIVLNIPLSDIIE